MPEARSLPLGYKSGMTVLIPRPLAAGIFIPVIIKEAFLPKLSKWDGE
jgi:hypothetical protein